MPPVGWDGIPLHGVNGIRFVKKYYLTTFPRQKVMETSSNQTLHNTEDNATSLQVDSLVSHTASQASDSAKKTSDIFGRKCLGLLEKYGRGGLLERMFAGYLVGMKGWYSKRCALTWKVKDTKSKRLLFQLQASALRTEEKEFGLLPTPRTADVEGGLVNNVQMDGTSYYRENAQGVRWGVKLRDVVENGLLPTPKTQDSRHALRDRGKSNLGEEMSELAFQNTGKTSQLSPLFVEEMMGFPRNWTVLPFQSGERKV